MLKIKFFHLPKPKQFKYTPRYFDAEREEREKRKKEALERNPNSESTSIHGAFTRRLAANRKTKQSSNIRLAIIIAILCLIAWWLLH